MTRPSADQLFKVAYCIGGALMAAGLMAMFVFPDPASLSGLMKRQAQEGPLPANVEVLDDQSGKGAP